MCAACAYRVIG